MGWTTQDCPHLGAASIYSVSAVLRLQPLVHGMGAERSNLNPVSCWFNDASSGGIFYALMTSLVSLVCS